MQSRASAARAAAGSKLHKYRAGTNRSWLLRPANDKLSAFRRAATAALTAQHQAQGYRPNMGT